MRKRTDGIKEKSQSSGTTSLRPRARIMRTLGNELISSDIVALIELVKNAYDADATRVLISFKGPFEAGQGSVEIIDNGHGMALDTIVTTWMEPATPFRKRKPYSEKLKRRVLGEKGIGRFAASRLADNLQIITRRDGTENEIRAFFDWTQFDDEEKYLDEISVPWEVSKPKEICPGGTIEKLWRNNDRPVDSELTHGTIMRMIKLRAPWKEKDFIKLRAGLSRLVQPPPELNGKIFKDEFQIRLELPEPFVEFSDTIDQPEILKNPHYYLAGSVDVNGGFEINLKIRGRDKTEQIKGNPPFPEGYKPQCGPFHIELRAWDRDIESLNELASYYGSTIKNIREDLDKAAGLSIYRDGFRVLPYGEPHNDWLRLDLRSRLNPTLRLANNQISGYILISADHNPLLRDKSDREGIIDSPAMEDLRTLILNILNELENRRFSVRRQLKKQTKAGGLFKDFELASIRDMIEKRHPEDTELLRFIGTKEKDLEKRIKGVQEVLARYRRLATLGQLIDTVLHEGRAPLSKIDNEAYLGIRDIERNDSKELSLINRLHQRFNVIKIQSGNLATVFRRIEPFGGRKRGRPHQVCLEQVIADAFAVLQKEIVRTGTKVSLPKSITEVTVNQAEIQEVIINLLQNSLYWLERVPKDNRQIAVLVNRISTGDLEIIFSDSGPGVDPQFREYIFDPYFSTKPEGVGLGLTIAGEIVSEYYDGALELLDSGPLPGATFRIILRRRV